ncbi:uncharacterized protein LOC107227252 [Neodiprion lecontei]|uniref:Uncharacterized protein LOC107227252 n=1 Tax=Neodiprion lecontei TaxID=441921 RepID=A0A6J0CB14_NEOLC|nr:uncharacterized protein LOC107227252 [Neodiprion lecontei]
MEDSYTVHRRRKAAARRREKTPDPPRREEESGEDDTVARAKMERMAEDTENMALRVDDQPPASDVRVEKVRRKGAGNGTGNQPEPEAAEAGIETELKPSNADDASDAVKKMVKKSVTESDGSEPAKFSHVSESTVQPRDETDVPTPRNDTEDIRNAVVDTAPKRHPDEKMAAAVNEGADFHPKKRSRDRSAQSKQIPLTDSSEDQDEGMRSLRRKKSPEGLRAKTRSRHTAPPADTDEDQTTSNAESKVKLNRDKRRTSRHRYSTGTEDESGTRKSDSGAITKGVQKVSVELDNEPKTKVREKRSLSRHRYPSESEEEVGIRKSETFPQRSADKQIIRRSASEMKKQIIPLKDDSLIEDFAKAQEEYLKRERGILDHDDMDDDRKYAADRTDPTTLRKRKLGVLHSDPDEAFKMKEKEHGMKGEVKKSWFSWFPFSRKQKEKQKVDDPPTDNLTPRKVTVKKVSFLEVLKAVRDIVTEFKAYVDQNPREIEALKKLRNSCIGEFIVIVIYCGLGAFAFRFTEGAFETFYKCGVKRVKRDFLDNLWNYSHNMREEDWKSMARRKLMEFEEQLHSAHEAGVHSYSGQKNWTFLNALAFCISVITTVGYGDIAPKTQAGKAITIVYAIFGIPMFLIILADFGKLFTRGMKFLWAFVRRVYYTGSCRKVRRTGPVQEVMKGVQLVYDFATFRRPSQMNPEEVEEIQRQQTQTILNLDGNLPQPETPGTPAMSNFVIDDEFNLPISVAISILLGYIFVGATVYQISEGWGFFESFYFVFISMSTIGFGDYVPQNSLVKMLSLVYLFFGLALTSMCINVVQVMLSDSFKKASQKIGASIGFEVAATDGAEGAVVEVLGEDDPVGEIQVTVKEFESQEEIAAPKAKPEVDDL